MKFYNSYYFTGTIKEIKKESEYYTLDFIPLETDKSIRFFVSETTKSGKHNPCFDGIDELRQGDKILVKCTSFGDKLYLRDIPRVFRGDGT